MLPRLIRRTIFGDPQNLDAGIGEPETGDSPETIDLKFIFSKERGCIAHSSTISKKLKTCVDLMISDDRSDLAKIKIANFIFYNLIEYVHIGADKKALIRDSAVEAIYRENNSPPPVRMMFVRYRDYKISEEIALAIYEKGMRNRIDDISYLQLLKVLLRSSYAPEEVKNNIFIELRGMFDNPMLDIYTKMEIADIHLSHGRPEVGNAMLQQIRGAEEIGATVKGHKNIYSDSQNVHDSTVNKSVISACVGLLKKFPPTPYVGEDLENINKHANVITIEEVIDRIEIDTSIFGKEKTFTLQDVFCSVIVFIKKHEEQEELWRRLAEEMEAMHRYCTTGHLSRLVNVLQGFTDDEELQIRISSESQMKAVVTHELNKALASPDTPPEVMDAMIGDEEERPIFYNFIVKVINKLMERFVKDYGENVGDYILANVRSYTGCVDFKLGEDKKSIIFEITRS